MRPFRFGLQAFNPPSPQAWRDMLGKVEDLGYATYHLADHFMGPGPVQESTAHPPQLLAAVPAMAMALEYTNSIKVGARVFCMDYRDPIMLAKEAATMDYLSDGRLELGLGAGWIEAEYKAAGMEFLPIGERLNKFESVVAAIKTFMGGEMLSIHNDHIQWEGFSGIPARPTPPPLMIGGGSKRVLTIAGREADIVSLNFNNRAGVLGPDGMMSGLAEQTAKKIGWIRDGAGDRFEAIELEIGAYLTIVTDHQAATAAAIAEPMGMAVDDLLAGPHNLIGSVDYICEELQRRRETYGISYITVLDDGNNNMVEQFAPVVAKLAGT
ncbi:MAG: TIGR03621 family F420-dependent LLM class oxidoreductase [Pseudomonadota bacterium]